MTHGFHVAFMCFVRISEQALTFVLYSITSCYSSRSALGPTRSRVNKYLQATPLWDASCDLLTDVFFVADVLISDSGVCLLPYGFVTRNMTVW